VHTIISVVYCEKSYMQVEIDGRFWSISISAFLLMHVIYESSSYVVIVPFLRIVIILFFMLRVRSDCF